MEYLIQLQADQTALQTILDNRRNGLELLTPAAGDPLKLKVLSPSVRLLHQAYIYILEDAMSVLNSLIEYFTSKRDS